MTVDEGRRGSRAGRQTLTNEIQMCAARAELLPLINASVTSRTAGVTASIRASE